MNRKKQFPSITNITLLPNVRIDLLILSDQVLHILGNGLAVLEMALVFKYGQMEHVMKASGRIIERMDRANSFMWMAIFMKVLG